MNKGKKEQLLRVMSILGNLNILKEENSRDIYIVENDFVQFTAIMNLVGSIGAFFDFSTVTDENNKFVEYHIIIYDYSGDLIN